MTTKISIVIQAGGESRRMGKNKALMPFMGQPMIQRVVSRVSDIADEVCITSNQPEILDFLHLPVFPDVMPGKGALGGIYTAFCAAKNPLVGIIACDMVFVSAALLAAEKEILQRQEYDGVVPHTAFGYEPFHAVYRKDVCCSIVERALYKGKMRADGWFSEANLLFLQPQMIARFDVDGRAFLNLNTPQDVAEAEAGAKRRL